MVDRIRSVMNYSGLSQQDFAARLCISAASMSSILTGRSQPTNKHVMGIHNAFPEINVNWLMFGEGDMIVGDSTKNAADGSSSEDGLGLGFDDPTASDAPGGAQSSTDVALSLFPDEQSQPLSPQSVEHKAAAYGSRRQTAVARQQPSTGINAINFDKEERRIKEIRVFYTNGTYESFVPSNR